MNKLPEKMNIEELKGFLIQSNVGIGISLHIQELALSMNQIIDYLDTQEKMKKLKKLVEKTAPNFTKSTIADAITSPTPESWEVNFEKLFKKLGLHLGYARGINNQEELKKFIRSLKSTWVKEMSKRVLSLGLSKSDSGVYLEALNDVFALLDESGK